MRSTLSNDGRGAGVGFSATAGAAITLVGFDFFEVLDLAMNCSPLQGGQRVPVIPGDKSLSSWEQRFAC
jgi:hypothetical protein